MKSGGIREFSFEAYFDESGTEAGSPVLSVGGYLFDRANVREFNREWDSVLKTNSMPYFRMSRFAPGNRPYEHLDGKTRIEIEKKLICIIKHRAAHGVCNSVDPTLYERFAALGELYGSAYTFCAYHCLHSIRKWTKDNNYHGQISYFFESGDPHQKEANALMSLIFTNKEMKAVFSHQHHDFVDKKEVRPLQAADFLAWHWCKNTKMIRGGEYTRDDFWALVKSASHHVMVWDEKSLQKLAARI
jgi:hypothetical protein